MIRHRVHRSHRVRKEDTCGDSLSATSGFCGKNTLRMPKAYPDIYATLGYSHPFFRSFRFCQPTVAGSKSKFSVIRAPSFLNACTYWRILSFAVCKS